VFVVIADVAVAGVPLATVDAGVPLATIDAGVPLATVDAGVPLDFFLNFLLLLCWEESKESDCVDFLFLANNSLRYCTLSHSSFF
jgi:hypothetical protein